MRLSGNLCLQHLPKRQKIPVMVRITVSYCAKLVVHTVVVHFGAIVVSSDYQKSERYIFLFNLLHISGAVWRNNIEVSVTNYRQPTDILPTSYRHVTDCRFCFLFGFWAKPIGLLSDNRRPTVDRQTADKRPTDGDIRPTGFFGSCSSQLPWFVWLKFPQSINETFLTGQFQFQFDSIKSHFL